MSLSNEVARAQLLAVGRADLAVNSAALAWAI